MEKREQDLKRKNEQLQQLLGQAHVDQSRAITHVQRALQNDAGQKEAEVNPYMMTMMKQLQNQITTIQNSLLTTNTTNPMSSSTNPTANLSSNANDVAMQQRDSLMMQAIKGTTTVSSDMGITGALRDWGSSMMRMANADNTDITAESLVNWVKTSLCGSMSISLLEGVRE